MSLCECEFCLNMVPYSESKWLNLYVDGAFVQMFHVCNDCYNVDYNKGKIELNQI